MKNVTHKSLYFYIFSAELGSFLGAIFYYFVRLRIPTQIMNGDEYPFASYIPLYVISGIAAATAILLYLYGKGTDKLGKMTSDGTNRTVRGAALLSGSYTVLSATAVLLYLVFGVFTAESRIINSAWFLYLGGEYIGPLLGAACFTAVPGLFLILNTNGTEEKKYRIGITVVSFCLSVSLYSYLFTISGFFGFVVGLTVLQAIFIAAEIPLGLRIKRTDAGPSVTPAPGKNGEDIPILNVTGVYRGERSAYSIKLTAAWLIIGCLLFVLEFILINTSDGYIAPSMFFTVIVPFLLVIYFVYMFDRDYTLYFAELKRYAEEKGVEPAVIYKGVEQTYSRKKASVRFADWFGLKFSGFMFSLISAAGLTGFVAAAGLISYGFGYPIYLDGFWSTFWIYAALGCLFYFILSEWKIFKYTAVGVGVVLYIILLYLLNYDAVSNLYTYVSGSFDIIFPFRILLGPVHAILGGTAVGILLGKEFDVLFGIDSGRGRDISGVLAPVVVVLFTAVLGLAVGDWAINDVPGGKIRGTSYYAGNDFEANYILGLCNTYAEFGGYLLLYIIAGVIIYFIFPMIRRAIAAYRFRNAQRIAVSIHSGAGTKAEESGSKSVKETDKPGADIKKETGKNRKNITVSETVFSRVTAVTFIICILLVPLLPIAASGKTSPIKLAASVNGITVYTAPPYIRPSPGVPIIPQNTVPDPLYKIYAAQNEYESFQIIIKTSVRSLNGFRYSVTDMVKTNGTGQIAAGNVGIGLVETVIDDSVPDKIVPFYSAHLIGKDMYFIWVTIYIPEDTLPGMYKGNITFTYGNSESFTIFTEINVWNFTVPKIRHLRMNIGGQTDDPEIIDTYLRHRINTYGVPIRRASTPEQLSEPGYTCYLNTTDNTWIFNWTWWDNLTIENVEKGMNAFYINCPLGMPREPIWVNNDDPNNISEWGLRNARYYKAVRDHLMDLKVNSSIDLFPYAYVYFIDEFQMFIPEGYTQEQYLELLEVFLKLIKENAPEIKIMTTSPPTPELSGIRKYIDIYCPITSDYNRTEWEEAKAEGKEMWMYPCVGPTAPWPNSHLYNRLYEIRVLLWQVFNYGIDGFLYWSSHAYYHGDYGMAFNGWGDGWFIYIDSVTGTVYDSIRWDNYRDAAEDYEYLWLLNTSYTYLINNGHTEYTEKLKDLTELAVKIGGERYTYCNSGDELYAARNTIGSELSELNSEGIINLTAIGEVQPASLLSE